MTTAPIPRGYATPVVATHPGRRLGRDNKAAPRFAQARQNESQDMERLNKPPADGAVDWSPTIATMPRMTHTWVAGWQTGSLEVIVTAARAAAWQCIVIERTSAPMARPTRTAIHAAGATVISSELAAIGEVFAAVSQRCRTEQLTAARGHHPLLLMVGDGEHIPHNDLDVIADLGHAADIHLAIDEEARQHTSAAFNASIGGVYRGLHGHE